GGRFRCGLSFRHKESPWISFLSPLAACELLIAASDFPIETLRSYFLSYRSSFDLVVASTAIFPCFLLTATALLRDGISPRFVHPFRFYPSHHLLVGP